MLDKYIYVEITFLQWYKNITIFGINNSVCVTTRTVVFITSIKAMQLTLLSQKTTYNIIKYELIISHK